MTVNFAHFIFLFFLFSIWHHPVLADEQSDLQNLVIGYQASPSLTNPSQKKEFSGQVADTVRSLCNQAKLNCTFYNYPLKRASLYLNTGQIDAYITIDNQQFRNCCTSSLWSTPAFFGLFSKKSIYEIPRHEKSMEGHSLITLGGSWTSRIMMPNLDEMVKKQLIKLYQVGDATSAVAMFLNNRAEFLWGPESFTHQMNNAPVKKDFVFLPLITRPIVIWFHKRNQAALEKFDQAFIDFNTAKKLSANRLLVLFSEVTD